MRRHSPPTVTSFMRSIHSTRTGSCKTNPMLKGGSWSMYRSLRGRIVTLLCGIAVLGLLVCGPPLLAQTDASGMAASAAADDHGLRQDIAELAATVRQQEAEL